jgi:hypothetical protein
MNWNRVDCHCEHGVRLSLQKRRMKKSFFSPQIQSAIFCEIDYARAFFCNAFFFSSFGSASPRLLHQITS